MIVLFICMSMCFEKILFCFGWVRVVSDYTDFCAIREYCACAGMYLVSSMDE